MTAQIVEFPEAISQAPTRHEAYLSVLDALHDLTHEPTPAERLLFGAESVLTDGVEALRELLDTAVAAARGSSRDLSR